MENVGRMEKVEVYKLDELFEEHKARVLKENERYREELVNLLSEKGFLSAVVIDKLHGVEGKFKIEKDGLGDFADYSIVFYRLTKKGTLAANPLCHINPYSTLAFDNFVLKERKKILILIASDISHLAVRTIR